MFDELTACTLYYPCFYFGVDDIEFGRSIQSFGNQSIVHETHDTIAYLRFTFYRYYSTVVRTSDNLFPIKTQSQTCLRLS